MSRHFHSALLHSWPQCSTLQGGLRSLGPADVRRILSWDGVEMATSRGAQFKRHYVDGRSVS